ncbi:MAG: hypothetical protein GY851_11595, partial [bacterium]|nr:hypothetical protein [bacterium]
QSGEPETPATTGSVQILSCNLPAGTVLHPGHIVEISVSYRLADSSGDAGYVLTIGTHYPGPYGVTHAIHESHRIEGEHEGTFETRFMLRKDLLERFADNAAFPIEVALQRKDREFINGKSHVITRVVARQDLVFGRGSTAIDLTPKECEMLVADTPYEQDGVQYLFAAGTQLCRFRFPIETIIKWGTVTQPTPIRVGNHTVVAAPGKTITFHNNGVPK